MAYCVRLKLRVLAIALGAADTIPRMRRALTIFITLLACIACETAPKATLGGAQAAYRAGNYAESLRLARMVAAATAGVEHDDASYLIGVSLLAESDPLAAAAPLREASRSADPILRAQALVSLGSALIALGEYADAGRAYAEAADLFDGAPSERAHVTAARCFARAGLVVESKRESGDAAEPDRVAIGNGFGSGSELGAAVSEQPVVPVAVAAAPEREGFTIQSGAFRDRAKADAIARGLSPSAKRCGLTEPIVLPRVAKDGRALYAVQVGSFVTRAQASTALAQLKVPGATVVER